MSASGCVKGTLVVIAAVIALSGGRGYTQGAVQPINDGPNPYEPIRNWGTLPEGRKWGSTGAVAMDPDGVSLWVAERCGANTCDGSSLPVVLKFDPSGKLVRSFGSDLFIFPHGIHVDREGNVWVTDAGANKAGTKGHQVFKFSPDGKILMRLGKAGQAGKGPDMFDEPNDVVVGRNGDIFVAEGHRGQNVEDPTASGRIVKFDRNGKFIKEWGKWGAAPGDFKTPHAMALDSAGRLLVADRGNLRIQIFDQDGKYLSEMRQFSRVSDLFVDKNDMLYAIDSESSPKSNPGWSKGIRIGSLKDGKVMFFVPPHKTDKNSPGNTGTAAGEGVAVDANGNIFGAEVHVLGLTKYVKRSGTAQNR
jgi:sugar lactone lactonase YvrE